jgi:hypothetical protein
MTLESFSEFLNEYPVLIVPIGFSLVGLIGGYNITKRNIYWDSKIDKAADFIKAGAFGLLSAFAAGGISLAVISPALVPSSNIEDKKEKNISYENKKDSLNKAYHLEFKLDSINQDYKNRLNKLEKDSK